MIEQGAAGLRPGMTATVSVSLGKAPETVLTVPVRSLLGRAVPGKRLSCLVLTADGPEEREVIVGQRGEDMAEVRSGLREGEEVIANPHLLLNDIRDRMRFLRGGRPVSVRGE
jgi:HlyD family secretion protein